MEAANTVANNNGNSSSESTNVTTDGNSCEGQNSSDQDGGSKLEGKVHKWNRAHTPPPKLQGLDPAQQPVDHRCVL